MATLTIDNCPTTSESNGTIYPLIDWSLSTSGIVDAYHSQGTDAKRRGKMWKNHEWRFGFEAEKVDSIALLSVRENKRKLKAMGFKIEADSSLSSSFGFEFISPIYPLEFLWAFKNDLIKPEIKRLIDADITDKCGGHMSMSCDSMTSREVFEGVAGFLPLLYAMYPRRTRNTYCPAMDKSVMGIHPEKYSAVYVRNGYIEFRIFPGIKNTKQLWWRTRLLRLMAVNHGAGEKQVLEMMLDKKSDLHKLLLEVFNEKKIAEKIESFVAFAKSYNRITIQTKYVKGWAKLAAMRQDGGATVELEGELAETEADFFQ